MAKTYNALQRPTTRKRDKRPSEMIERMTRLQSREWMAEMMEGVRG